MAAQRNALIADVHRILRKEASVNTLIPYLQMREIPVQAKADIADIIQKNYRFLHTARFRLPDDQTEIKEIYTSKENGDNSLYVKLEPCVFKNVVEYLHDVGMLRG